jgi:sulfatase-modifying factor enzyme 1
VLKPALALLLLSAAALALAGSACSAEDDVSQAGDEHDAALPDPTANDGGGGIDAERPDAPLDAGNGCPEGMARIPEAADAGKDAQGPDPAPPFCVDRYEAYVVEVDGAGKERAHSPYDVVEGLRVRAKVGANVVPQAYISQVQATAACEEANKRLCTAEEFALACRGASDASYYPYGGKKHVPGKCNEGKGSFVPKLYGPDPQAWTYEAFNDPRLNQIDGGLARTGEYAECVSPLGVHDCVGNLHEWGADPADPQGHGRFRGGFYGDAEINGPGCLYVTRAHELSYHDYSTGFRCCADAASK